MADGAMQCYRNHYTFGMPPEFSIPDFVRAFRRVAKKLHPDRNPNKSEEFKELTRLYKILTTPALCSLYYEHGSKAVEMGTLTFSEKCHVPSKTEDSFFELEVSDYDLLNGCIKRLISIKKQYEPYIPLSNEVYGKSECIFFHEGSSTVEKPDSRKGPYFLTIVKGLNVYIAKGMQFGERIILKEEGEEMPRHKNGDLVVILVKEKDEHNDWERKHLITKYFNVESS